MADSPNFIKRMADFNRLLEGENRESGHPEDAEHWYLVYKDLVTFKESLLAQTKTHINEVPETRGELGGHDVPFLEHELGRLRSGLAFWAARRNQPGSGQG